MDADAEIFFDSFVNSRAADIELSFLSQVVELDEYAAKLPSIASMFAEGARETWVARMATLREYMHAEHEKSESALRRSNARLANHAVDHRNMPPVDASTISHPTADSRKAKSALAPELTADGALLAKLSVAYADIVSDTLHQREYSANAEGTGLVSIGSSELLYHPEVTHWVPNSLAAAVTLARESVGREPTLRKAAELLLAGRSVHAGEQLAKFETQHDPELSTPQSKTPAETDPSRNDIGRKFLNTISNRIVRIVSDRAPSALEREIQQTPGTRPLTRNTRAAAQKERQRTERERNEREFPASSLEPRRMPRWFARITKLPKPPPGRLGPINSPQTPSQRVTLPGRTAAGPDNSSRSVAAVGFMKPERSQLLPRSDGWAAGTPVNSKHVDLAVGREVVRELRK
ncbi:hypothetical protein GCM10023205_83530 [Yinghuangia aomiensis]|uniref:Uncharacterized protein n=1 Tax=Yinghuangia aomiensis TaxID=676205 RepID=A0ABP9IGM6_9ACTN